MEIVVGLLVFISLVSIYAVLIRPWLRKKEWAQGFFANPVVEWMEIHFWRKSETVLVARAFQLVGVIGATAGYLGGIDYSIFALIVPEAWQPFLPLLPTLFNALGAMMSALRRDTTLPLEVVELPQVVSQKVAVAIEKLDEAKHEAVAAVQKETDRDSVLTPTREQP